MKGILRVVQPIGPTISAPGLGPDWKALMNADDGSACVAAFGEAVWSCYGPRYAVGISDIAFCAVAIPQAAYMAETKSVVKEALSDVGMACVGAIFKEIPIVGCAASIVQEARACGIIPREDEEARKPKTPYPVTEAETAGRGRSGR
jgi:hypothetical protein